MKTLTRSHIKIVNVNIATGITRRSDDICAHLIDAYAIPTWRTRVVRAWYVPHGAPTTGAILHVISRVICFGREVESQLAATEFQPGTSITLESTLGPFQFCAQNVIEAMDDNAKLRCNFT
ncbi:MAG: hypothetical protein NVS2B16_18760 [Chloroflexota bacterium]